MLTMSPTAPAWGIAMATWQGVQKVIDAAKRPNIKHCLDTYHISGYIAGDPKNTNGNWLIANAEAAVKADADELGRSLRAEDIAYFQVRIERNSHYTGRTLHYILTLTLQSTYIAVRC